MRGWLRHNLRVAFLLRPVPAILAWCLPPGSASPFGQRIAARPVPAAEFDESVPVPSMNTTSSATPSATAVSAPASVRVQRRWLVAYGLYTALISSRFSAAIWLVYLALHGYSPFAIGLFEMLFHVVKFLAEVPSGAFADLVGRRASLIVSCVLLAAGQLLFLAPSVPGIALSFTLLGAAYAFRGGADSALLWNLVERSGAPDRAARYSRLFSRMFVLMLVGDALGAASSGFLSGLASGLPFVCEALAAALAILPLLPLPEQRLAEHHRRRPLAHIRAGAVAVGRDPALLGLVLLSGLAATIYSTVGLYSQLYFRDMGFSLAAIGLIFAAAIGPDTLMAALAPRIIRRLPQVALLATFLACEVGGLLAMSAGQPILGIAGYLLLFHSADSVLTPAISTYLNARSPEEQRATVLSFDTGLFSAGMIVVFPLFGLGLTHASFDTAFRWTLLALVGGGAAIAAGVWWLLRRQRRAGAA